MTALNGADVLGRPWAILPETLRVLRNTGFASWGRGPTAAVQRRPAQFKEKYGVVSVIPMRGVITHRESQRQQIFGGTSIERLRAQFRESLRDSSVLAIVFDVDSPGGEVSGTPELALEIPRARAKKKTVAVANGKALAGAYWLASSAEELVVTESGSVGSIGIYAEHQDLSKALEKEGVRITLISAGKYKTDGHPTEPLSDSAREDMQAKVDALHAMFVGDVASGRGVSSSKVRGGFGQGRTVLAAAAVKEGMADRVGTLDQTLARFASGREEIKPRALASYPWRMEVLRREFNLLSAGRKGKPPGVLRLELRRRELDLVLGGWIPPGCDP
jgi:signal peptide peptidase SppA